MWGEISSSSWGKETIRSMVTPPDKEVWAPNERNTQGSNTQGTNKRNTQGTNERNTQGTNKRMGGRPQAQENKSKLIQAKKALEIRDRVLTAAIRKCHIELAKKESLRDSGY